MADDDNSDRNPAMNKEKRDVGDESNPSMEKRKDMSDESAT